MAAVSTYSESKYIFTVTPEQRNALLSSQHTDDLQHVLQPLKDTLDEHGFVLVRGLLDEPLQQRICSAAQTITSAPKKSGNMFTSLEFGPVFNIEESVFREVSLNSAIPSLVARLLQTDEQSSTLRLLKDAFMAKGKEEKHCGWHVDDTVFWPTDSNSSGINAWLSLDNIPQKYGGGLAVSPKSHTAEWRQSAYEAIGSTPTLPPQGLTPEHLLKTFGRTCDISNLNPEVNKQIDSSKLVFDYQAGDCLFCHRWLFHRSVPVNEEGMKHYTDNTTLKRYTIRYERGEARLIKGVSLEPSILMNDDNSGRSLDEVCTTDEPYYPQCWPPLQDDAKQRQESRMEQLAKDTLPQAQVKKMQIIQGLMAGAKKEQPSYS